MVSNVVPVRSEGRGQFHGAPGNLRWDAALVCRKVMNNIGGKGKKEFDIEQTMSNWHKTLDGLEGEPSQIDWENIQRALEVCNEVNANQGSS
jgi:hypothetical protein